MKRLIKSLPLVPLILIATISNGFGQSGNIDRKNIVFAEAAGALVVGYGLGYERYLYISPLMRGSLRLGAGGINNFSKPTAFFGGSYLYGNKSSLEIGLNYLFHYDASALDAFFDEPYYENDIQLLVGYRYQNWKNGITFRVFYTPPVGCCAPFIPVYGGASLGYAW